MTTERKIKIGRQTAVISFLLGTCIFGLYLLTSSTDLLFIGYIFIVLMGPINIGILISMLVKVDKDNKKKLLTTSGLMLLNIPVMLFYCWVAILLLDTMRITFTNSTQSNLTNIVIVGCGGGQIDKLEIGESKTVWVEITGDCSISVYYLLNRQQKKESVAEYVTSNMGQKIKHNIGGQNSEHF
jgi:hypothetical protein